MGKDKVKKVVVAVASSSDSSSSSDEAPVVNKSKVAAVGGHFKIYLKYHNSLRISLEVSCDHILPFLVVKCFLGCEEDP